MDDAHALPNDLAACQRLLLAAFKQSVELEHQVADAKRHAAEAKQQATELSRVLDETAASYGELQTTHQAALEELSALKRWIYGRRTEKLVEGDGQRHLFDLESSRTSAPPLGSTPESQRPPAARRRRRELDLDKLPHYRHEHDLSDADKQCSGCGRAKDRIGQDESRILEYVPAKLEVHVHVRPKYACRYCKDGVTSPPPPERPIARGIAGPGLIAQIVVAKFGDHLPLYRQEDFFTRHGLHIARSTQCDWVHAAAELLRPLYERQKELLLQSPVLWTDDTPVTLLGGGREESRPGRFWAYIAEEHPYSVYDFTESRARDGPANFLQGFQGYLHADAYGGYDHIYLGSNDAIREVACWAHARRKFFDAIPSSPRDVHQLLEWIRQLYDVEDRAREMAADARRTMRAAEAEPVLDRIEVYLAQLERRALPKSVLAKAVSYAQNQWPALRRYTTDGRLSIDNNVSERTLRHQAVGRKNWLFVGSAQAGPRAAVLFTILAGAKRHRIEPWAYLRELLLRAHADDQRVDEMLPDRWAAEHPDMVLTYRLEESRRKAARQRDQRQRRRARCRTTS
jgi:transposase